MRCLPYVFEVVEKKKFICFSFSFECSWLTLGYEVQGEGKEDLGEGACLQKPWKALGGYPCF